MGSRKVSSNLWNVYDKKLTNDFYQLTHLISNSCPIVTKLIVFHFLGNGEETTEAPITTPEAPEPTPDDNGNFMK